MDENGAKITRRAFLAGFALAAWQGLRHLDPRRRLVGAPSVTPSHTPSPAPTVARTQTPSRAAGGFDVVILNGRVIDPESGFDSIANVGIKGDRIDTISTGALRGTRTIDASGKVVSAGFIDNLSYEPNEYGVWFKLADGITTTLGMHGIDGSAERFFTNGLSNRWPVHYGGAFDDPWWRAYGGPGLSPSGKPTSSAISALARDAERQILDGFIGVDFEPEYDPGTSFEEEIALARVAARHDMPFCSHVRYADAQHEQDAITEVVEVAKQTGVAVHVDHINSTGGTFTLPARLQQIQQARDTGIDITACEYPYNFWSTFLGSARFAPGWQDRFRISYGDLALPGTGERLTASSFKRYRAENKVVIAYAIPEDTVRTALASSLVMFGSDTILIRGVGRHPRGAGSASRILGHHVRDEKVLSLKDGLAKLTIMPAKRVEKGAPQMKRKGRMQEGMDADVTIFDPRTIIDLATVRDPYQYSRGVDWVLVMGNVVKDPSGMHHKERHGTPIISTPAIAAGKYGVTA
ncbi:MAG: amidohydrolase family protein [Actinomycetota bacterium]